MLSMEKRMEGAFMREIDEMEQRLHEVARQGRKEQTGQVVSALNSCISKGRVEGVTLSKESSLK